MLMGLYIYIFIYFACYLRGFQDMQHGLNLKVDAPLFAGLAGRKNGFLQNAMEREKMFPHLH